MLMNRSRLSGGCARAFMNKYGVRVNFDQLLTKQLQFIPDTSSSSKKIHNANKNVIICTQNISHRRLHLSVTKMFLVKINLSPVGIKFSRYCVCSLCKCYVSRKSFWLLYAADTQKATILTILQHLIIHAVLLATCRICNVLTRCQLACRSHVYANYILLWSRHRRFRKFFDFSTLFIWAPVISSEKYAHVDNEHARDVLLRDVFRQRFAKESVKSCGWKQLSSGGDNVVCVFFATVAQSHL